MKSEYAHVVYAVRSETVGLHPIARLPTTAQFELGTSAERLEINFINRLTGGSGQRIKAERQEHKNYYAKHSQNAQGLQIGQPGW